MSRSVLIVLLISSDSDPANGPAAWRVRRMIGGG